MQNPHKKQLRDRFLSLLSEKMGDSGASAKDVAALNDKFDQVLKALKESVATQFITKVPDNIAVTNLDQAVGNLIEGMPRTDNEGIIKAINEKEMVAKIDGPIEVNIPDVVTVKQDPAPFVEIVVGLYRGIIEYLERFAQKVFTVRVDEDSHLIPQMVVFFDPVTKKAMRPQDIFNATVYANLSGVGGGTGGGAVATGYRGAPGITDGTVTVVTNDTRVQFPDFAVSRVFVQSHIDNTDDVVIGGIQVDATKATRRGLALAGSQWQEFAVTNLNKLWIDSETSGQKVNYLAELPIA